MAKKYIDADKLKAEITKHYDEYKAKFHQNGERYYLGLIDGIEMTKRIVDSLQQEQPSEDLEKAAENQANTLEELIEYLSKRFDVSYAKLARIVVKTAKWQKSQMLKEAVEGEVYRYDGCQKTATAIIVDIPSEPLGDKVKIVIVKED